MKKKRVRNIVPPLVLSATFVGVVPACALASCGGAITEQFEGGDGQAKDAKNFGGDVATDAFGNNDVVFTVACCFGVADAAFQDADDASDAPSDG